MFRRLVAIVMLLLVGTLSACQKAENTDVSTNQTAGKDNAQAAVSDALPSQTAGKDNTQAMVTAPPSKAAQKDNSQATVSDSLKAWDTSDEKADVSSTIDPSAVSPSEDNTINGTEGDSVEVNGLDISKQFYYTEISDEVKARINGKSYKEDCSVPYEDLRYVSLLYWGFDEETHTGELIVNKAIAQDIVDIFKELYEEEYPIERMVLVDEYDADDDESMAADNSSSFNYRKVDGTDRLSLHSYGLAIDINPLYNPYVRGSGENTIITPENGVEYADRTLECPYYIDEDDACYKAFTKRGFTWGGDWKNQKDYQHFQKALE